MNIKPIEEAPIIAEDHVESGRAAGHYKVRLIKEYDTTYANAEKARELWNKAKQFPVLFSDYTKNDLKAFLRVLARPDCVWFELLKDNEVVGLLYLTSIIPHFDAVVHMAMWDKIGSGREPVMHKALYVVMHKYDLVRVSAEVPVYQKGAIRFLKRFGFTQEGIRRKGVLYKENWVDQALFGILREEINFKVEVAS